MLNCRLAQRKSPTTGRVVAGASKLVSEAVQQLAHQQRECLGRSIFGTQMSNTTRILSGAPDSVLW